MTEVTKLTTPIGRYVQGDMFNAKPNRKNPNLIQFFVGLAIKKDDPKLAEFKTQLAEIAKQYWPKGEYKKKSFAWKKFDGDDEEYAERFAGHEVYRLTTGEKFPPRIYPHKSKQLITNPEMVQRGDFIRCIISVKGNANTEKPGLYLTLQQVEFIAYGERIKSNYNENGFDHDEEIVLPVGASKTPIVSDTEKDYSYLTPDEDDVNF